MTPYRDAPSHAVERIDFPPSRALVGLFVAILAAVMAWAVWAVDDAWTAVTVRCTREEPAGCAIERRSPIRATTVRWVPLSRIERVGVREWRTKGGTRWSIALETKDGPIELSERRTSDDRSGQRAALGRFLGNPRAVSLMLEYDLPRADEVVLVGAVGLVALVAAAIAFARMTRRISVEIDATTVTLRARGWPLPWRARRFPRDDVRRAELHAFGLGPQTKRSVHHYVALALADGRTIELASDHTFITLATKLRGVARIDAALGVPRD